MHSVNGRYVYKVKFLYSTQSSHQDWSRRFIFYIPIQSNTFSTSLGSTQLRWYSPKFWRATTSIARHMDGYYQYWTLENL